MTSMPASRKARAMIFAPRSWPSSPGLAISTRILFSGISQCPLWDRISAYTINCQMPSFNVFEWNLTGCLSNSSFFVCAENIAQGGADFAERRVSLHGVVEVRHEIFSALRGAAESRKTPNDLV